MVMEKFGSCVWICENFLFWWGIEFFLFFLFFFILCVSGSGTLVLRNFFFWYGNFWSCGFWSWKLMS